MVCVRAAVPVAFRESASVGDGCVEARTRSYNQMQIQHRLASLHSTAAGRSSRMAAWTDRPPPPHPFSVERARAAVAF